MRPQSVRPVEYTPVFDWSPPRRRKLSVASFLAGSVALHALCFYLFQIIYPPTVALLPPPARVNMITGDSDESRALLRWIEAEDPALSSTTRRPPDAPSLQPPAPAYVPSFAGHQPVLREPPLPQQDLSVPSAQPPAPVPTRAAARPAKPQLEATTVLFGSENEPLEAAAVPPLKFTTSGTEPPQSARFHIAINAAGEVRYCFLERSSGDGSLDEQARATIALCRFRPTADREATGENALRWTSATIEWGNDLAPAPSGSAAISTP